MENHIMTDTPKPPEGYETWIEAAIAFIDPTEMICTGRPDDPVVVGGDAKDMATAELAQLREQAAAYREAMTRLNELECSHHHTCPWHDFDAYDPDLGKRLGGKWYKPGEEPVCECPACVLMIAACELGIDGDA